jgi:hypothetical protein
MKIEYDEENNVLYAISNNDGHFKEGSYYEILKIDFNENILSSYFNNKYSMNFSSANELSYYNGEILYKKPLRDAIMAIDKKGEMYVKYLFNIMQNPLPNDYEYICRGDFSVFIDRFETNAKYTYTSGPCIETNAYLIFGVSYNDINYIIFHNKLLNKNNYTIRGYNMENGKLVKSSLLLYALGGCSSIFNDTIITSIEYRHYNESNIDINNEDNTINNPVIMRCVLK